MATLKLTQDFRDFLQLLDSEKIEYLLIGGYAVALYGYVRATKDIDIYVSAAPENQQRLRDALAKFGFSPQGLQSPLFTAEKTVLRMGVPPNRLEVLCQISGVEFRECHARRRMMEIDGLKVSVIDFEDLLRNKRASGRDSDRIDVERLEKRRKAHPG